MEILGLLDALESLILDSFKIPLTGKVVADEGRLLAVIDKIRLVVSGGDDVVKRAIDIERFKEDEEGTAEKRSLKQTITSVTAGSAKELEEKTTEIIEQAYEVAREIRLGADKYADEVLANLEAASARILRTIKNGRLRIARVKGDETKPASEAAEEKETQ